MDEIKYKDSLITINDSYITFFNYGIFGGSKTVNLSEIEKIDVLEPNIWTGKYRYHGSGDFRTWFPADYARSKRDAIFIIHLKKRRLRIGFTVDNSREVIRILKGTRLIREDLDPDFLKDRLDTEKIEHFKRFNKRLFIGILLIVGIALPLIILLTVLYD